MRKMNFIFQFREDAFPTTFRMVIRDGPLMICVCVGGGLAENVVKITFSLVTNV